MSAQSITTTQRPTRRLSRGARTSLLTAHVITAVGLLGVDVAALALEIAGWRNADPVMIYPAVSLLVRWLLIPLAILSWLTGVALGLLTPWGLLRHWWVTLKLVINTAGLVLAVLVLLPLVRSNADQALAGQSLDGDTAQAVRNSTGACVALVLSVLLATFKPVGRLRGAHPRRTTP
jgi:hypothetical protein